MYGRAEVDLLKLRVLHHSTKSQDRKNKKNKTQGQPVVHLKCQSQASVGEIGTVIWAGKRSENTDFWQGTARRIRRISPTESWDLHKTAKLCVL